MSLKTGLTDRTITSLQLNAGVLLSQYTKGGEINEENIIGATRGGGSFTAVPTVHQAAVDGAPVYTKGLERCDEWVATLNATMLEFNKDAVLRALGMGATATTDSTDTKITVKNNVSDTDYKDVYWVGDTSDGKNVVIKLKNALNLSGFNLNFTDKGEGTYALSLVAHYDIASLDTAPFEITFEGVTA